MPGRVSLVVRQSACYSLLPTLFLRQSVVNTLHRSIISLGPVPEHTLNLLPEYLRTAPSIYVSRSVAVLFHEEKSSANCWGQDLRIDRHHVLKRGGQRGARHDTYELPSEFGTDFDLSGR